MRHTLFISDLHLDERHQLSTKFFEKLINHHLENVDALYILGDFFELWIGDDDRSTYNEEIKAQLKAITDRGIPVYFLRGNHDFLIGRKFARATGCKILPEPSLINVYNREVLLIHGDMLCTLDKEHMKFRKLMNSWLLKKLFLILPIKIRKKIGLNIRQNSRNYTKDLDLAILDVVPESVNDLMLRYKAKHMIHGHTHRPRVTYCNLHGQPSERIVLGSWELHGCMLKWFLSGKREMVFFK